MTKSSLLILLFWALSIPAQKDSTVVPGSKLTAAAESSSTKPPEFPGGHGAFVTEILKYFRTSPMVKAEIMSAKAVATFIVDAEGNMLDIKIESYEYKIVRDEFS